MLDGSNYNHWVEAMRGFLKGRRLWRYVTGDIVCPTAELIDQLEEGTNAKLIDQLEEWDSKNHQIITWFRNTSVPGIHLQFGRFDTAKEVWDHLQHRYTSRGLSRRYQLLKELHDLKQTPGLGVFAFLAQMEAIWDQLAVCEPQLKHNSDVRRYAEYRDETRLIQFLMALTDDYEPVRASLLYQDPLPTLEDALPRLQSEETRLGLLRPKSDLVFATSDSKRKYCGACRKPGHVYHECPTIECHLCRKKGHIASRCPSQNSTIVCRYCKLSGHLIDQCPTRPPRPAHARHQHRPATSSSSRPVLAATTANDGSSYASQPPISASDLESLLKQVLSVSGNTPTALATTPGNPPWYFDSACCNHMTSSSHVFSTLSTRDHTHIHTADGSLMEVSHKGPISLPSLTMPDTYLIPKLNFNLISVGQLCDLGYTLTFSSTGCSVQDPRTGQVIGNGRKVGRMFELTTLHVPSSTTFCAASTPSSIHLWHQRLGHTSLSKLRPLISQGSLGSIKEEPLHCTACQTAKQTALPFNPSISISASPFDLVHSDVWGPAPTPTMGGCRYFIIFIDDFSRFTWIYLLKNRSEIPQIYINFATMIHTQFSKCIKTFRRDNASEYRDSKLLSFLAKQGTTSEFSCPGTSQQNGRAERKHRHILDSIRAMLFSSSCPERIWGEAALTAVYVINRLPSSVLGNVSPFERLYDTRPHYGFLKVFGCACFVLLQPHEYSKLEPRARLCCFLGYGTEHKGYRVWDPISQRIRVSRHVVFWEHKMFSSLSQFKSISSTSTPLFTDPSVDLFPDDINAGSSSGLTDPSEIPIIPDELTSPADPVPDAPPPHSPGRVTRVRNPPSYLRDYHCFSTMLSHHEPQTYREASADPKWQQAMQAELQALESTNTWELVDHPDGRNLMGCKWVFKVKTHSNGSVERYKARLVAKGFTQEYGIDYEETFAPVARLTSLRTLLAIATTQKWPLNQMDVKNAFLNGDLDAEIYMRPPLGYNCPPHKVCRLRKSLYGLKQASRSWFSKFHDTISQLGFSSSPYDHALFLRRTNHGTVMLLLYVDDMIITGDDSAGISTLKQFLSQHFEMKDLGTPNYFLGIEILSSDDGLFLSQAKYASDLLSRAGLTDCKTESTPLETNVRFTPLDGTLLDDPTLYRQLVGSLIYLTVTRPDLAYAVHLVSQFMSAPRTTHYAAVLRILRYIKGTIFHGLHYSADSPLILRAYSDADWGGDPTDRRSITGFCIFLGDSLISWRSKKQQLVSRSSTEAEYRALADTTSEILWIRWLLGDLGFPQTSPSDLYCDNRSAIQIAHNDVFHERTKHIEIDCHITRQQIVAGTLHLIPISTLDQPADLLTKAHHPGRFRTLVSKLKLVSSLPT